jgi:hypothetical protein
MVVIIYSAIDLEPITAIDLPAEQIKVLNEKGALKLVLTGTDKTCTLVKGVLPPPLNIPIYATSDEENALMLKAAFLPGQLNSLRLRKHGLE